MTLHPFAGLPRWAFVVAVLVLMDLANWTSHLLNHRVGAVLALSRAAPLAGGAEHPHLVPRPPLRAHQLPAGRTAPHRPGDRRRRAGVGARRLRRAQHDAAHECHLVLRATALRDRDAGVPPAAPRPRRPPRRQPGDRARAVGRAGRVGRDPGPRSPCGAGGDGSRRPAAAGGAGGGCAGNGVDDGAAAVVSHPERPVGAGRRRRFGAGVAAALVPEMAGASGG